MTFYHFPSILKLQSLSNDTDVKAFQAPNLRGCLRPCIFKRAFLRC